MSAVAVGHVPRAWQQRVESFNATCDAKQDRCDILINNAGVMLKEFSENEDGFELTFTEPVDAASVEDLKSYEISTYTYIFQSSYGSPEVDHSTPKITRAVAGPDGQSVRLYVDGLQRGHVHELHAAGVRSGGGLPLLHAEAYYTLNYLPAQ